MGANAFIDIAIGLVLMYLVLSLLCTVINEYIASFMALRAKNLQAGLQKLLDVPALKAAFDNHGLIAGVKDAKSGSEPSYLPGRTFAMALLDSLDPVSQLVAAISGKLKSIDDANIGAKFQDELASAGVDLSKPDFAELKTLMAALPATDVRAHLPKLISALADSLSKQPFANLEASIKTLPDSNIRDALLTQLAFAQGNLTNLRDGVATWFDDSMDRLGGLYKRNLKLISLGVGLALAVILNADTVAVGTALWKDANLRAVMVQSAQSYFEKNPPQKPPQGAAQDKSKPQDPLTAALKTVDNELRPLPIGWDFSVSWTGRGYWEFVLELVSKLLGLLLTGLALTLGAPFWFDLLSKFVKIRGTGTKPERTEDLKQKEAAA